MATLYLKGQNNPIEVEESVGDQIEYAKKNRQTFIKLSDGKLVEVSSVKLFTPQTKSDHQKRLCERLDETLVRESVKNFERELENYIPTEARDAEYYGIPVRFPKQTPEMREKYKDWAINPLLGGWHKNIIQYALDNRLIARVEAGATNTRWGIRSDADGTTTRYTAFYEQLAALRELQRRRDYAEGKSMVYGGKEYNEIKEAAQTQFSAELPF